MNPLRTLKVFGLIMNSSMVPIFRESRGKS